MVSTFLLAAWASLLAPIMKYLEVKRSLCILFTSVVVALNACWRLWISLLKVVVIAKIYLTSCVSTSTYGGGACGISISLATQHVTACCYLQYSFSSFSQWFTLAHFWASNVVRFIEGLGFSGTSPDGIVMPAGLHMPLMRLGKIKLAHRSLQVSILYIWL